ncbi:3'-5' exonuclease [Geotoga petraea]|jgi:DNA polymerase-3 subunit epsilon|uniref:DNA polymerase-3 subunit epsilon n=1 Tax=Geotoga petraea TaxID=28234 RepID=A0A1G6IAI6_9BACT|nr:3'-5' exonuclease [Geotoga petraea]MDK2945510.1 polymerase subunit epsilon [Geotoga sp.]SDC03025.1 DNA polymerase-3 subunit epsilon [Geotoga petraea]
MINLKEAVFVAFDFETTGLSPYKGDRIIEIAAVPIYENKIKYDYIFQSLVNPEIKIPAQVSSYHKLNNSDIDTAPLLTDIMPKFKNYISNSVLISHNVEMDLNFLDIAAKESGIYSVDNYYLDTLEISRFFIKNGPYNLESLSKKLKLGKFIPHRARDDAIITAKLFLKLVKKFSMSQMQDFLKKWRG